MYLQNEHISLTDKKRINYRRYGELALSMLNQTIEEGGDDDE